jgi:hypothetical protein
VKTSRPHSCGFPEYLVEEVGLRGCPQCNGDRGEICWECEGGCVDSEGQECAECNGSGWLGCEECS